MSESTSEPQTGAFVSVNHSQNSESRRSLFRLVRSNHVEKVWLLFLEAGVLKAKPRRRIGVKQAMNIHAALADGGAVSTLATAWCIIYSKYVFARVPTDCIFYITHICMWPLH